jgi:hypothetical protein
MTYPKELIDLKQWVCWRLTPDKGGGSDRKVPYNPITGKPAASNKPETWADYETAKESLNKYGFTGLGFMFTEGGGIVGVDIDHCYDPETSEFNETAKEILKKQPTYAEFSPSGTGLHLFYKGIMPGAGNKNSKSGVEMYGSLRYFTMTGKKLPEAPSDISDDHWTLNWIHDTYIKTKPKSQKNAHGKKKKVAVPLRDEELLDKALSASDSIAFSALWEGNWKEDFASQSEADLALCCKLAFWSGKDKDQMDRLFRKSSLFRDKWDERHHASGATYGEETIVKAIEATEEVYGQSSGNPIFEFSGCYFRAKGENTYPITNFLIRPVEMLIADDETAIIADLVTVKGEIFRKTFQSIEFSNQQKFKGILNKNTIALCYHGTDGDLELLKGYLYDLSWAKKAVVKEIGIHRFEGELVFATADVVMKAGGKQEETLELLDNQVSMKTEILKRKLLKTEELKELGPKILGYNEPAKTVSVIAWAAGCFIKEHLRLSGIKFPHLMLIGESGSGKSNTLDRVVKSIFSIDMTTAAGQITRFTLMKEASESNTIPLVLDEFKPSKLDRIKINDLYNHFRNSYDGHLGTRGRADQTMVTYKLLAPLVVAGEEAADEAAIRERSIELLFSKKDLKSETRRANFKWLRSHSDHMGKLGRSLLEMALTTKVKEAEKWHEEGSGFFNEELPARVIDNLSCCYAGLKLLERLCKSHGITFQEVFDISQKECLYFLEYAAMEYLLDGSTSNKSVVEQSFEIMARMGLDPNSEFELSADGTILYLWLNNVYDKFTKYKKDHSVGGETLSYAQFKKQLEHSVYHEKHNFPKRIGSEMRKVWVINYSLLKEKCEVPGFEITDSKPI